MGFSIFRSFSTLLVFTVGVSSYADDFRISHDTCALMLEKEQLDGNRQLRMQLFKKGYKLFYYDYELLSEARFNDREAQAHLKELPFSAMILNTEMDVDRKYLSGWSKVQKYNFNILEVDGRLDPIDLRDRDSPNGYLTAYRGMNATVIARAEKIFENSLFDFGTNWAGGAERAAIVIDELPSCKVNYN